MAQRREPITAPPAQQPRYSLLTAVGSNGTATAGDRWERGVSWTPEACGGSGIVPANCGGVSARETPGRSGQAIGDPFYVWAADECDSQGFEARDWQGRARRQLEATQSFQIARELWTGGQAIGSRLSGNTDAVSALALTDRQVDERLPASEAIGVAEALVMQATQGQRAMIHVPVAVLERASENGHVVRDTGGVLTTAMGNIVVADAGYPGTGPTTITGGGSPDNTVQWIYGSRLVQVRLGAVELLPATLEDARGWAEALDRGRNDVTVWAQRLALYQLDPCGTVAVSTNVPALPTPTDPNP